MVYAFFPWPYAGGEAQTVSCSVYNSMQHLTMKIPYSSPLYAGEEVSVKVPFLGQIDMLKNHLYLIGPCTKNPSNNCTKLNVTLKASSQTPWCKITAWLVAKINQTTMFLSLQLVWIQRFSFLWTSCPTKAKEHRLSHYMLLPSRVGL